MAGVLGALIFGFAAFGCGGRLGPVRASQTEGGIDRPTLASIAVERSAECMADYGTQLPPGRHDFKSTVGVNEEGYRDVRIDDVPNTAPDFGACVRNVLAYMPIPAESFQEGVETLKYHREHASEGQDSLIRFIKSIPGVPIVVSELVLEAEGYTVVLPVTVKVVEKREKFRDLDKATLEKIGQLAMATLGYDEIMRRAEMMGWVKRVPIEVAQSVAGKMVIANEATASYEFRRIFTKWAVAAAVASQVDSPVPGPGDAVALALLVGGLCHASGVAIHELLDNPTATATPTATAAPATSTATSATPTTTTTAPPRKYPNQTCTDAEMARLENEMHTICDKGFAVSCGGDHTKPKFQKIPCSAVKLSIQQRQACVAARWEVQDKCFGGKPDDIHKKPIDDHQRGIDNCEALKLIVCAPGHPMAGK